VTSRPADPASVPVTRRAVFAAVFALGALAAPLAALAQPPAKVPRVGVIGEGSGTEPLLAAFRQGLRDLGYVEGRNILVEYRSTHGVLDRIPGLAAELVRLRSAVLVVGGTVSALSVKAATTTVPIVFTQAGDPVGSGLVASLARPGGNVTGLSNLAPGLAPKQLEVLRTAAPHAYRVAVLYNPVNPTAGSALEEARAAARAMTLDLKVLEVRRPAELAGAFTALTGWRAEGLLVVSDPVFGNDLAQLAKLTGRHRLPAVYSRREFVDAGGLVAYGPSFEDNYRRAAAYVDRILRGTRPGDLPVEQPTRFELAVNLRTARALGLTIAQDLLLRADRVVQ
jgi:putative ABC transport system substrate-binding protein